MGATGVINAAGDSVSMNVPCATANKVYRFSATCLCICTATAGLLTAGDSWVRVIKVFAVNIAGTVTILGYQYEDDAMGSASMGQDNPGGACSISVQPVAVGTNVVLVAVGNGNNGASPLDVTWSGADQWGGT